MLNVLYVLISSEIFFLIIIRKLKKKADSNICPISGLRKYQHDGYFSLFWVDMWVKSLTHRHSTPPQKTQIITQQKLPRMDMVVSLFKVPIDINVT